MRYADTLTFTGNASATTLDYDALLVLTGPLTVPGWCLPRFAQWVGTSATRGLRKAIVDNVAAPREPRLAAEMRSAP